MSSIKVMKNGSDVSPSSNAPQLGFLRWCRRFRDDEEGSMTVFVLMILVPTLIVAGMAVDFMRQESRRVQMQGCLDASVLAGAKISVNMNDAEASDRTQGWADAAGCGAHLTSAPEVVSGFGERTVTAQANRRFQTFFLHLAGISSLDINGTSTAYNSISNTEISLVLDISGSMRYNDKIKNLRDASVSFASTVLDPSNGGTVSLNVIPYAGQVNPGREMFNFLGGTRLSPDQTAFPHYSSCLEIGPGAGGSSNDFRTTGLPTAGRSQVAHFMHWPIAADVMGWGWCPQEDMAIRYAQKDAGSTTSPGSLNHFLANMRMHDGTGTHYGMKYALALLDPSSQAAFGNLSNQGSIPTEFRGRPVAWDQDGSRKIIVLMTDGIITDQFRPKDPLDELNLTVELAHRKGDRRMITNRNQNVQSFYEVCDQAKDPSRNVTVFTVAFEAPPAAQTQMRNCATSPSHYFNTSGTGLTDVFERIANEVSVLRLTN